MKKLSIVVLLIALSVVLSSHRLFLKSDSYFLKANSQQQLYLYNGTFDKSDNVITRDRIVSPQILGPEYKFTPSDADFYNKAYITFLRFKTGDPGTYVAGISTKPRTLEMSGSEFTSYLEHEGLTSVIEEREKKGISDKTANEKYSKHVKTLLQVDTKLTDDYSTELNYPIEFIPLKNPYSLSVGDKASFKLMYLGKPLTNKTVQISSRHKSGNNDKEEIHTKTNNKGVISFKISNEGHWYVSTIHLIESNEEGLDYESNWATLTFEVK